MVIQWSGKMDVGDYRGEVCMILRDQHLCGDLADELGGKSDEWIEQTFQGFSPEAAAFAVVEEHFDTPRQNGGT